MKTIKYTLAKFMVAAIVAVVLVGCKKEGEPQADNGNPTEINDYLNDEIVSRLVGFNKLVTAYRENPSAMKSDETMPADEAVANISDLFNVVYGQATEYYEAVSTHEFTIELPLNGNGEVLTSDVAVAYEQVIENAREAFLNDGFSSDKGYLSLTIETENMRGDALSLNCKGTSGKIGKVVDTLPYHPFDSIDNWKYKYPLGRCTEGGFDSGADKQIEENIYWKIYQQMALPPRPGGHWEYVDLTPRTFDGTGYPNLFYRHSMYGECIDWTDMNLYFNGEMECLYNLVPNNTGLAGYHLVSCIITGDEIGIDPNRYLYHQTQATYARLVFVLDELIEEQNLIEH